MAYRVRCRKVEGAGRRYRLQFGRGRCKRTALVEAVAQVRGPAEWLMSWDHGACWGDGGRFDTLGDAKRHFEATVRRRAERVAAVEAERVEAERAAADVAPAPAREPWTAEEALEAVLQWAKRNHRDLTAPPWSDCARVLARGRDEAERAQGRPGAAAVSEFLCRGVAAQAAVDEQLLQLTEARA